MYPFPPTSSTYIANKIAICRLFVSDILRRILRPKPPQGRSSSMNSSVIAGCALCLRDSRFSSVFIRLGYRWSCFRTPATSLLCARLSLGRSLGAQKTSQSETSKSSVFQPMDCKATTTGSRISTNMEPRSALLTCNSLSCVVQYLVFRRGILIWENADRRRRQEDFYALRHAG
jgi:hypothetical protein